MISSLKITILVENTAGGRGLLGEHGLSFLIEADNSRILFDTGQGMTLIHNGDILGVSLNNLDAIALSHGHYDHSGGLVHLLPLCKNTDLYLHPNALMPKYSPRGDIGFSLDEETLSRSFQRVIKTEKPTEIAKDIYITGSIPRNHPLEDTGGLFWHDQNHHEVDPILDDQALYLDTYKGLFVILGCAHAGVINTLDYISQITNKKEIYGVIGGMHLLRASQERLMTTVETLKKYNIQLLGANHCTGIDAISFLWHELKSIDCRDCRVGTILEIESMGK
ncbi:MBL fold metallo-hydrolase [Cyanobacterium aponinum AL20118]|uniref:MBL fold metallo-hydrolase n=1 Tax=Cyanobacterium aponinum AL20115 TaxID=3090662 RepID=A0AAF0ZB79_9CHRO|nr:MBL fold metallo-hydrolase [Cyanobacterium aponinum]WPF89031.1 MBL fold metallo-hydrolase [Cyanobacterium aponinum AL20115]